MVNAAAIKDKAKDIGFDLIGITTVAPLTRIEKILLHKKRNNLLPEFMPSYNIKLLTHPKQYFPPATSIISLGISYAYPRPNKFSSSPYLSLYSRSRDYHYLLKNKMKKLLDYLQQLSDNIKVTSAVDTSPLLERELAQRAGLGWIGKNNSFINKDFGSFIFLGEILTNLNLAPDSPASDQCKNCSRCLNSCPTGALSPNSYYDYKLCASYLTQKRGMLTENERLNIGRNIWGCDICQNVCPYNQDIPQKLNEDFQPQLKPDILEILNFRNNLPEKYKQSALFWRGERILRRNAIIVVTNLGLVNYLPKIRELIYDPSPVIRAYAIWSLSRLDENFDRENLKEFRKQENHEIVFEEIDRILTKNSNK